MRLRFIPFIIYFFVFVLVVKLFSIVDGRYSFAGLLGVVELNAEQVESKESSKPGEGAPPAEVTPTTPAVTYTERPQEMKIPTQECTQSQIDLLSSLSKRRDELNLWRDEMATKEATLKAAEMNVNNKLSELSDLKNAVSALLAEYNQKEDMKINSLVKIYENMKPKDAAKIFEGLDMHILLPVIARMKEAKTAPILAQMDPVKATELTIQYANQKKLPAAASHANLATKGN